MFKIVAFARGEIYRWNLYAANRENNKLNGISGFCVEGEPSKHWGRFT